MGGTEPAKLYNVGPSDGATPAVSGDGATLPAVGAAGAARVSRRPAILQGVRVPSRNSTVRDSVCRLYSVCWWLDLPDLAAVTRLADLYERYRRLAAILDALPDAVLPDGTVLHHGQAFVRKDFEPRKLLGELRGLAAELRAHEAALGITAAARASLGVDIARLRSAAKGSIEGPPEDVQAVEARIMRRLDGGEETEGRSD